MKAVILAAGHGSRFSQYGVRHKALLPVNGQTVIDYTLDGLQQAGITDISIVIGHEGQALQDALGDGSTRGVDITYVVNLEHHRGNAVSVLAAKDAVGTDPFILSMADHMPSADIILGLVDIAMADAADVNALAVDFDPADRDVVEGTRVSVDDDGHIVAIGKRLPVWNGIDCGVFRFTPAIFNAIEAKLAQESSHDELSQAVTHMIQTGNDLHAHDVEGAFWFDVDTWEDLKLAREALGHDVT